MRDTTGYVIQVIDIKEGIQWLNVERELIPNLVER